MSIRDSKIIFWGTPEIAAHCLEHLINSGKNVVGVVTQPDKPAGRKQILTPSPVKVIAEKAKIHVFQPETLKNDDFYLKTADLDANINIIVAYGKIIPKKIIDLPAEFVNLHFSLLPKYRGAAPAQRAIIDGLDETGITVQFLAEKLDCGEIILQEKIKIEINDTSESLLNKCAETGAPMLSKTVELIDKNIAPRITQNDDEATFAPKLTKDNGIINWKKSAREIHDQIRGCYPWPGTVTKLGDKQIKIWKSVLPETSQNNENGKLPPGTIETTKKQIFVHTEDGIIELIEIQSPGKTRMSAQAFLSGHRNLLKNNKFE